MLSLRADAPSVKSIPTPCPSAGPGCRYVLRSGEAAIDEDGALSPLVENFLRAFPEMEGDVAVWDEQDAERPRLLGVIRQTVAAGPLVTWL